MWTRLAAASAVLVALGLAAPAPALAAPAQPRQIAPDLVAPPQVDENRLEREAPRPPLSHIGPAGPAKPKRSKKADDNKLFMPLATAAGVIEVQGLTVTVAGIDVVQADETCDSGGKTWPCGMLARTAFRNFLRGRAPACDLPPAAASGAVTARCTMGKRDIGEWLVANGWARAAAGGPYEQQAKDAEKAEKGIFGPAPTLKGMAPEPAPYSAPSADQAILAPPSTDGSADSGPLPPPAVLGSAPQPLPSPRPQADPQGLY